ncbi:MAG TPA: hypothetical protein VKF41_01390 [Bryobacteraceae bacterium]|nr:hypothetical protein [Bryobacteraceae bacterium]
MKRIRDSAALLAILAATLGIELSCTSKPPEMAKSAESVPSVCALPTTMAGSNEQTAWQLFVAASCPVNGQLTWETWTEQTCFAQPDSPGCAPVSGAAAAAPVRHLHASRLGERLRHPGAELKAAGAAPGGCSPMTTAGNAPAALKPFVPKNLTSGAQFCEEVFADPSEAAYVKAPAAGATLTNLAGQVAYASSAAITFPVPAVEVKADWLPASSLSTAFDCTTNPPAGVYVETISGTCYALVGIHLSSKLLPNWLWATFEPQNTETNPNRCNPKLYDSCNDPWGSNPAASTGQATEPTAALTALMTQAGLPKQFLNYRLVAAQSAFVDTANKPVELGNSFVEFNAQVLPHQASCMTCHSYALVSTAGQENPNFGNFPHTPPIGKPGKAPLPAQCGGAWVSQDFSWMLGILPASPPKTN